MPCQIKRTIDFTYTEAERGNPPQSDTIADIIVDVVADTITGAFADVIADGYVENGVF